MLNKSLRVLEVICAVPLLLPLMPVFGLAWLFYFLTRSENQRRDHRLDRNSWPVRVSAPVASGRWAGYPAKTNPLVRHWTKA